MVSRVDDLTTLLGHQKIVDLMKGDLGGAFMCKLEGPLKEFMGSKIDLARDAKGLVTAKFAQPILVQKLKIECQIDAGEKPSKTPVNTGLVFVKGDVSGLFDENTTTEYRSATTTCMFMMRWSRPEIYNVTL